MSHMIKSDPRRTTHIAVMKEGKLVRGNPDACVTYVDMFDGYNLRKEPAWQLLRGVVGTIKHELTNTIKYAEIGEKAVYIPTFANEKVRYGYVITAKGNQRVEAICLKKDGNVIDTEVVTSVGAVKEFSNIDTNIVEVVTDCGEQFILEFPAGYNIGIPVTI